MSPLPVNNMDSDNKKVVAGYLYGEPDFPIVQASTPSTSPSSNSEPAKSQFSSLSDGEGYETYFVKPENRNNNISRQPIINTSDTSDEYSNLSGELALMPQQQKQEDTQMQVFEANGSGPAIGGGSATDGQGVFPRDIWSRMSLRHPSSGRRQITTNGQASQLYRSSSFNSSGRSSNCDTTEDMYDDVSLEDVNYKIELLQNQVSDLTQNAEDRTSRTKAEYAVLQARFQMLEDQYREAELRAEDKLAEEQKRHREILARMERESLLQNENCQIKIKTTENELNAARDEVKRLRVLCDKQTGDLQRIEEKLELARDQIVLLQGDLDDAKRQELKYEREKKDAEDLMLELSKELERLRTEIGPAMPTTSPESIRLDELHQELEEMRRKNRALEEQCEELQAAVLTRGVEEGRHLLNGTMNSLAQELEEMSQTQDSVDSQTLASLSQLQKAYQEKEEENQRLRHYIDTILLNIVENYPQLLEVKPVEQQKQQAQQQQHQKK